MLIDKVALIYIFYANEKDSDVEISKEVNDRFCFIYNKVLYVKSTTNIKV